MKHTVRLTALLLAVLLVLAVLAGCGQKKDEGKAEDTAKAQQPPEQVTAPPDTKGEEGPENYLDITGVDFSSPGEVIAADDYDGMYDFSKRMQNFLVPEGTIVELSGVVGSSMMTHTIVVYNPQGDQAVGTTYEVVGDVEFPAEGTPIHIIGVVRMGEYYPVVVVPAELFQVVE